MSRPLRIELAGGLYHVTSRGDRREAIDSDDQDRTDWLGVLGDVCSRFNWRCHAWCQMTNHDHIVVETPETNLSKGMRQLNGVFSMQEIADAFGVHYSTVSRSVRRLEGAEGLRAPNRSEPGMLDCKTG